MQPVFLMLYVEGARGPTQKHASISSALDEAERLAKLTGRRVHILAKIDSCIVGPIEWENKCQRDN